MITHLCETILDVICEKWRNYHVVKGSMFITEKHILDGPDSDRILALFLSFSLYKCWTSIGQEKSDDHLKTLDLSFMIISRHWVCHLCISWISIFWVIIRLFAHTFVILYVILKLVYQISETNCTLVSSRNNF